MSAAGFTGSTTTTRARTTAASRDRWQVARAKVRTPERSGRGDPGVYSPRNRRIPNVSPAVASTVPTIHRMSLVSRLAISVRTSLI